MLTAAIAASGLSKTYMLPARRGQKEALKSLDLAIRPGEIYGFLGPNGAGKTTTIKILLGFIRPTAGRAFIFGRSIEDPDARQMVGYLPEQPYFHKFLTPAEIVRSHAALAGIARKSRRQAAMEALEITGLQEYADTPISKLSKGLIQRIGIAQALVGRPMLLMLDEPTSGLDPIGRKKVKELLIDLRTSGTTVFLCSHLLSEVEYLCDRVGILNRGSLVAEGPPAAIKRQEPVMTIRTTSLTPDAKQAFQCLGASWRESEGEISVTIPPGTIFKAVHILEENGLPLIAASTGHESLEDAFLRLAA